MSKIEEFDKGGSMELHDIPLLIDEYKTALAEKEREIDWLRSQVANFQRWLSNGVYYTNAEYEEQVRKPKLKLKADLYQVVGEAVWAMRCVLSDYPEGCSAWCNANEFLASPLVQSWQARQQEGKG